MIAEAVVSFVVEKLGELLADELIFLHEVRGQVKWLEGELMWMRAFLKDAETKQNDALVKKWVAHVRDIAYRSEDVIDDFILKIEQGRRRGLFGSIKKLFKPFSNEITDQFQLGKEIEEIKKELDEISTKRSTYGIKNLSHEGGEGSSSMGESLWEKRRTSPLLEDTEIVGFQEDVQTLVARLIENEPQRRVISIVGMGGLGNTTLTRKVYNHHDVKRHFDCCAWIYVSQEYDVRDLLLNIMRCFMIPIAEQMSIVRLREKLFLHLQARRYFVVVDDIWKTEAWDALAAAFPNMNNGSRVLLTTRNREVASHADPQSHPHELQLLAEHESWKLFCKKTFLVQDIPCPQHLEGLGRQIVAKCHGLPLAVVVIAGLLSRKTGFPSEWAKVLKSISWQFVEGDAQISRILALSYEDLPYHLKSCFLYLGIFPEDYEISSKKLIWLWVAEGFVHSRGAETLEEVAEDCLEELIQRSLVQIVKRRSIGGIKSCRIHDLLRDLLISKAKEENFLHVANSLSPCSARRLTIHHDVCEYTSLNHSTKYLRSIIWFNRGYLGPNQQKFVFQGFLLLRVLHLHEIRVEEVPNEIGTLIHLRYLQMLQLTIPKRILPPSIANLCNLQTLHVSEAGTSISVYIPSDIWKMKQLRHVHLKGKFMGEGSQAGRLTVDELSFPSNLQTLKTIWAGDWIEDCLGKLINLKKLGIAGVDLNKHGKGLLDSIPKLDHLQSLMVRGARLSPFPSILYRLCHLYKLRLNGWLVKLPESHEFSPNLTKLTLDNTRLVQDPMTTLEKLTNLWILILNFHSYMGKEMVCSVQGFLRLESLKLIYLDHLEDWRIEVGAMTSLLHLHIEYCRQLKMLPEGLHCVTTLKKLEIYHMYQNFTKRLREDMGEDWHKIQHIPSIDIR